MLGIAIWRQEQNRMYQSLVPLEMVLLLQEVGINPIWGLPTADEGKIVTLITLPPLSFA
jgi:hypothetical protein